jgi:selenophosphate synthase
MKKKIIAKNLKEVADILADPTKIITDLAISVKNDKYDPKARVTEEGFQISKDFILAMYRKMRQSNGKDITATFKNCKTLGDCTVSVTIAKAK